ncbi:PAS domain-containing protein [Thioclava sp. A2]|uniref:PAS domain-containing protein n=1 Tax=Thioclava sp. FCG-A2 TaxID=3080562 RepID=UPI002954B756|nr:PAS domain-containing protein [Thioclava sp. A2]MDV7269755.1 PAS domain-containing protein [Thioclava sp. A2]
MERDTEQQGNVIALGQPATTGARVANEMRAYWEALRGGRLVPSRADVDPRGIDRALECAFILERVAPGMGRFRLAGMHLNDLMGMEVRGMPLTAFFAPVGRKQIAEIIEAMFQQPAIVEIDLRAETAIGKPELKAKLLILPLKSDLGDVTRALGCLVAEGDIGRTPRRFEVVASTVTPIIQGTPTPREEPAPVRPEALNLIDGWTPFIPKKRAPAPEMAVPRVSKEMTPEERRAMFRVVPAVCDE